MAITVTYEYPVAGATAPTALQAGDLVTANVISTSSAAAVVTISHNMMLTAAELAKGFPQVILTPLWGALGTEAVDSDCIVTAKATATVTISKGSATTVGALPQLRVHIRRPHSIGQ